LNLASSLVRCNLLFRSREGLKISEAEFGFRSLSLLDSKVFFLRMRKRFNHLLLAAANMALDRIGLQLLQKSFLNIQADAASDCHQIRKSLPGALFYSALDCADQQLVLSFLHHLKSQLGQDLFAYITWSKHESFEPYFVEFGATDGLSLSNTYFLEKNLGWKGILAEPALCWRDRLVSNRGCNLDFRCVWSETGLKLNFTDYLHASEADYGAEYSGVTSVLNRKSIKQLQKLPSSVYEVETVSINDLLDSCGAPKRFAYLSIDTEGSEYQVLSRLDFGRYHPLAISVEHNYEAPKRRMIYDLLLSAGYTRVYESVSKWDDWYVRQLRL
jgi:hypothetical protein